MFFLGFLTGAVSALVGQQLFKYFTSDEPTTVNKMKSEEKDELN